MRIFIEMHKNAGMPVIDYVALPPRSKLTAHTAVSLALGQRGSPRLIKRRGDHQVGDGIRTSKVFGIVYLPEMPVADSESVERSRILHPAESEQFELFSKFRILLCQYPRGLGKDRKPFDRIVEAGGL